MVTMALNDNWIEFTVRYIVAFRLRRLTKDMLFRGIMHEFDNTDGRVGLASSTFGLTDAPTIDVRIRPVEQDVRAASECPLQKNDAE
jgi:hypothetical protein